jgi:hypothetical protein
MATAPSNPTADAQVAAAARQSAFWGVGISPTNIVHGKAASLSAYLGNSTSAQTGADFVVKPSDMALVKLNAGSAILAGCIGTIEWKDPDGGTYTAVGTLDSVSQSREIQVPGTYRVRTAAYAGLAYGVQLGN